MDNTQRFSGRADNYTAGRPAYAEAFVESLYEKHGFGAQSVIGDIGSGTGKFAAQLLAKGSFVYGVEPNDDMRIIAGKELDKYARFKAVKGTASETSLPEASLDFVTTAQAFHWFDVPAFQKECRRILKKDGKVFLIWNMRDMSQKVQQRSFEIFKSHCPEFHGFSGGIREDDDRISRFFDGNYERVSFDNPLFYDREKFIRRCLSSSYALQEGDAGYETYLGELTELFEQYAVDGRLMLQNKTVAYFGKLS